MLAARQILAENLATSPWLRRHPQEKALFFQLMVNSGDPLDPILDRLERGGVDALDLNLACNTRLVRACKAGSALFDDFEALRSVVSRVRRSWRHLLTVKIRFGHEGPQWQQPFVERLKLFEDAGVDAVVLHARFFEDKLKRRSKHELFSWAASQTRLPVIANGDLADMSTIDQSPAHFQQVRAVMLGRMAIARPWVFGSWGREETPDLTEIWYRMSTYIEEAFAPAIALRRLQMFTKYFSTNFKFGHQFNVSLGNAKSLPEIRDRAAEFFSRGAELLPANLLRF